MQKKLIQEEVVAFCNSKIYARDIPENRILLDCSVPKHAAVLIKQARFQNIAQVGDFQTG